jgi:sugar/nucleoside kinase (ribokinase family)
VYEILSIGEILIDMMPYGGPAGSGELIFEGKAGGSAANVACVAAKLGHSTAFVGKVGRDAMGERCVDTLKSCGVDTSLIKTSAELPTTLAIVSHDSAGDRSFGFYRTGTADTDLRVDEIGDLNSSKQAEYVHFGGVSLSKPPLRDSVLQTVISAGRNGSVISYDPNLREMLWDSMDDARMLMTDAMKHANIIKLSEEEGDFFFGETDPGRLFDIIYDRYGTDMIMLTRAERGCVCRLGDLTVTSYAYDVNTVDTTGAGDAFLGGALHSILRFGKRPAGLTEDELAETLNVANAVGSLVTTAKGAIDAIPTQEQVEKCISDTPKLLI